MRRLKKLKISVESGHARAGGHCRWARGPWLPIGLLLTAALLAAGCGDDGLAGPAGAGTAVGGSGAGTASIGGTATLCDGPGASFVTEVVAADYGPGQSFGRDRMPEVVYGPPRGGGCCAGSLDVVSLGNGGQIVVAFGGVSIVDGPGVDFIVFENAFEIGGEPESVFAELATVEVSADGRSWLAFSCTAVDYPYGSCAGWRPVHLDGDPGVIDPDTAGGDPFDLADVGLSRAEYVRITDREDLEGPDGVFDLDAVGIVHAQCP